MNFPSPLLSQTDDFDKFHDEDLDDLDDDDLDDEDFSDPELDDDEEE